MTISFQGSPLLARPLKSAWVTSSPPDSRRSSSPSRDETSSSCPVGNQSKHRGNEGKLTVTMTSRLPSRLTASISCAPQSATHRRPSRQRGDSPKARPVNSVCSSGIERLLLRKTLFYVFRLPIASRNSILEVVRKDFSDLALLRTEPGFMHPLYQFCQISYKPSCLSRWAPPFARSSFFAQFRAPTPFKQHM